MTRPDIAPTPAMKDAPQLLMLSFIRSNRVLETFISELTFSSSALTILIFLTCASHAGVPRSMDLSSFCRKRRALFRSWGVALLSWRMVRSTALTPFSHLRNSLSTLRSSFLKCCAASLLPARNASSKDCLSSLALSRKRDNSCSASLPFTDNLTSVSLDCAIMLYQIYYTMRL